MTTRQYLDALAAQLYFLTESERAETLREFESHIDDTLEARPDLDEEAVVDRLPPPASVAARYYAETGPDASDGERDGRRAEDGRARSREGGRARGGFSFGDLYSMFRFARREERELSGEADGVDRVMIESVSCDVSAKAGESFSFVARGRWSDETAPRVRREGGAWRVDCGPDADELELVLPESVVELIANGASGDLSVELPPAASAMVRTASGDVSCRVAGGAVELSSASGDVSVSGRSSGVRVGTASGDIYVEGASGEARLNTQSGDIMLKLASEDADAEVRSASGDIAVRLFQGATPALVAESVSGDISAPGDRVGRGPVGSRVVAEGGPGRVRVKSVSGDISVR
jgi:hypothetical protein